MNTQSRSTSTATDTERCDELVRGAPYPMECGRTLPCDVHRRVADPEPVNPPSLDAELMWETLSEVQPTELRHRVIRSADKALEAARAEGRREAMREIRERFGLLEGIQIGHGFWNHKLNRILDEVAALNASESPQTDDYSERMVTVADLMAEGWKPDPEPDLTRTQPIPYVGPGNPLGLEVVGDTSESVQPPESHGDE